MAYSAGELAIRETFDSANDYREGTYICLPHSCNEWVIGGPAEAEALIADLREAVAKVGDTIPGGIAMNYRKVAELFYDSSPDTSPETRFTVVNLLSGVIGRGVTPEAALQYMRALTPPMGHGSF